MTENLKEFLLAVADDKEWIRWVNALAGRREAIDAAVEKAGEMGLPLSVADFEEPEGELSEDELGAVAGGACRCTISGAGVVPIGPETPDLPSGLPFILDPEGCANPNGSMLETFGE